jgi:acyl-coenzyme A synthetase/AMP-(fatty) acid ligase
VSAGSLTAALVAAPADRPVLVTRDRAWTGPELVAAAAELAGRLGPVGSPGPPLVVEVAGADTRLLLVLAAELTGRPVLHSDPEAPAGVDGQVVRDKAGPALEITVRGPGSRQLPAGAHVFFTSGSTGDPVGVVRPAAAMLADARRVGRRLGYAPGHHVLTCVPLFHSYGFNYGLYAPLLAGATVHQRPPASLPSQLARAVRGRHGVTMIGVPFHFRMLATAPAALDFAEIAVAVSSAAPLDAPTAEAVATRYAFRFHNAYGSSETGAISLAEVRVPFDPDDVGRPLPGLSARITEVPGVPDAGELQLGTDSLSCGYLDPAGLSPLPGTPEWYPSGDLATLQDGAIQLRGRLRTMINVAGRKISPGTIERALAGHPAIAEVQVTGAADGTRGQVAVARVVTAGHLTEADLLAWCQDRLAAHLVPHRVEFVTGLAKSATGKLLVGRV